MAKKQGDELPGDLSRCEIRSDNVREAKWDWRLERGRKTPAADLWTQETPLAGRWDPDQDHYRS